MREPNFIYTMLGIIINPKSGKRRFRHQRRHLFQFLRRRHEPFTYRVTLYATHAIELARELVEKGYDRLLVLGGDGTLNEVVTGIMQAHISDALRARVQVGLMPRGTGNDYGRFWGLTRDFKKSLDNFFNGKATPVDVGRVTFERNGEEQHYYFINSLGFGVDPLCCMYADKLKPYIGSHHVNYLFGLIQAIRKQQIIPMKGYVDGQFVIDGGLFVMSLADGPYSGGGMKLNPTADPRDGVLNGMFIERPTFKMIMRALPTVFNGKLTEIDFVHSLVGQQIELQTKKHLLIECDGILHNFIGSCKVECLKHAIQFVTPKDFV